MLFPALSLQILEYAREHGRVILAELVAQTGAKRNTLKAHLRKLVAGNHLVLAGKGRSAWYIGRPSTWPWRGMPGKRRMCAGRRSKRASSPVLEDVQQPVQERFCRARPKRLCKSQRVFFLAEACTSALTCPVRKCWQLSRLQAGSPWGCGSTRNLLLAQWSPDTREHRQAGQSKQALAKRRHSEALTGKRWKRFFAS